MNRRLSFKNIIRFKNDIKKLSALAQEKTACTFKMQAWQVHSYGEEMLLSTVRTPIVHGLNDVLVKVEAVSVNPIDFYMKDGYARNVLNMFRSCEMELPLTLGRDFCGTIVGKGIAASEKCQIGSRVYGFIPLHNQGSFAEYVIAKDNHICLHPEHLTPTESASIMYAAMTAWGALFITGGLQFDKTKNKRVLILGASGGVGTLAVQILKSQGIYVAGTCSTNAVPLVKSLGADVVLDYSEKDYLKQIAESSFDIILDCAKFGVDNIPKNWKFRQFITLNSPLMINTDEYGIVPGLLKSGATLLGNNITNLAEGKIVKWAFFIPSETGLRFISKLVENNEIRPVIHKTIDFDHLPDALDEIKKGHLRGKVVVNIE